MAAASYFDTVQKIYIAFYQRPADPAGLKYWADRIDAAGGDASAVVTAFAESAEAVALYGTIDASTIGNVIDAIYLALFNRAPDAAGKQFYVDGFIAGTFTAGSIALSVLDGAAGDDAVAIQNKAQVANEFTQQVDGRPLNDPYFGTGSSFDVTYQGDTDAQAARDILKTVTANPASVISPSGVTTALQDSIADATDPIIGRTSGETFMLTVELDTIDGTPGNDTINVPYANPLGGTYTTLQAFDTIKGGAGVDTLNIYVKGDPYSKGLVDVGNNKALDIKDSKGYNVVQTGTIEGVEIINAYNGEGNGWVFGGPALDAKGFGVEPPAIDAAKFVGAEQIWQIDGNTNIINLASNTTAGFRGDAAIHSRLTAAAGVATINAAFDVPVYSESSAYLGVGGAELNAVHLTGALNATYVELNIDHSMAEVALTTDFDLEVTFEGNSTLHTLNAADTSSEISVDGKTQLTSITTGSGDDWVITATSAAHTTITTGEGGDTIRVDAEPEVKDIGSGSVTVDAGHGDNRISLRNGAKAISVTAGDGDDQITVHSDAIFTGAETLTVDAGDGYNLIELSHGAQDTRITTGADSDLLWIDTAVLTETKTLHANLGAGSDQLNMQNVDFAGLPATWSIDAGESQGDMDAVVLGAGTGRTFAAADYVALTENLQGFEILGLLDYGKGETFNIDASRLTGYEMIAFIGAGTYNLTQVTDQVIGIEWSGTLNINAGGNPAQDLNVIVYDTAVEGTDITATGNTLNMAVMANAHNSEVYVAGDLKAVNATLRSTPDTDAGEFHEAAVYFDINHEGDGVLANLQSIQVAGTGFAYIENHAGGALATVDASGLTNAQWDGVTGSFVPAPSLIYMTENNAVQETIGLGAGLDAVLFGVTVDEARVPQVVAAFDAAVDFQELVTAWENSKQDQAAQDVLDAGFTLTTLAGPDATPAEILAEQAALEAALKAAVLDATLFASTVLNTDTIEGLNLVAAQGTPKVLDFDASDVVMVGIPIFGGTPAFAALTTTTTGQSLEGLDSLNLALQAVAQSDTDWAVFQYQGNTYIYGDKPSLLNGAVNQLDDSDLLVKLTGTIDLDLLVSSLNHVPE
ncbi:DUF4214 domain-containing protein [Simplicispira metamorpha]|uniref:Uncharacterized protein DUF4214 n=2 Tax=Simplicispira metamorpha TaxID=80881 RepID=A0A4R2NFA2_9BURK|nr:DUF4214 domain-containing protein [Simplicispira metamorpha]TCP19832.1 uncharacterized protein DUF4214 [Simplicispira metamorpha]